MEIRAKVDSISYRTRSNLSFLKAIKTKPRLNMAMERIEGSTSNDYKYLYTFNEWIEVQIFYERRVQLKKNDV